MLHRVPRHARYLGKRAGAWETLRVAPSSARKPPVSTWWAWQPRQLPTRFTCPPRPPASSKPQPLRPKHELVFVVRNPWSNICCLALHHYAEQQASGGQTSPPDPKRKPKRRAEGTGFGGFRAPIGQHSGAPGCRSAPGRCAPLASAAGARAPRSVRECEALPGLPRRHVVALILGLSGDRNGSDRGHGYTRVHQRVLERAYPTAVWPRGENACSPGSLCS